MAFSQEIRFKIGGDTSGLKKSFADAKQMAEATGRQMQQAMDQTKAATKLNEFRSKQAYKEADTIGKIKLVTKEIAGLVKERGNYEQGSVKHLQTQLAIEQKVARLRKDQRLAQSQRVAGMAGLGDAGGGGGGSGGGDESVLGNIAGGFLKRFIWLGAGAAMNGIINVFANRARAQAEVAQAQERSTGGSANALLSFFGTRGGLAGQLRSSQQAERGISAEKGLNQGQIDAMKSSKAWQLYTNLTPEGIAMMASFESKQADIEEREQQQHLTSMELTRQLKIQTKELNSQDKAVTKMRDKILSGMLSPLAKARIEAGRADALVDTLTSPDSKGTPEEIAAARIARQEAFNNANVAAAAMKQHRMDTLRSLTGMAGAGRTFANGAPQPLTETERLAREAAQAREDENSAILSGNPGYAANRRLRAIRLESLVGSRLQKGSSQIPDQSTADLSSVPASLETANQLLSAINASLGGMTIQAGNPQIKR